MNFSLEESDERAQTTYCALQQAPILRSTWSKSRYFCASHKNIFGLLSIKTLSVLHQRKGRFPDQEERGCLFVFNIDTEFAGL